MAKELKSEVSNVIPKNKNKEQKEQKMSFVFNKEKYIIMLIGLALIFLGFALMIGGGTKDPNEFSYELFSFRRITLAPILVVAGFAVEVYAIMKKPKKDTMADQTKSE